MAAAALGAEIFEFHAVFHKKIFGPDSPASLTIEQIESLVKGIKNICTSKNANYNKSDNSDFDSLKNIFEKSLALNRNIKKGENISFGDLEAKKPKGYGIDASKFQEVIGKTINKDLKKGDFIKKTDII